MWWVTVLPRCYAERILGISMYILHHCHWNVFLETAANPYVTALGDPESAPRRLNLAQSFNGLGAFIAAMFLSKLILSGNHYTRNTLPASFPGGWEGYIQTETDAMKLPYLLLAMLLIVIAIIFIFSKLPKIKEGNTMEGVEYKGEKLIDFGVLKRSHLRWGVIAQFFYNGGQTAINSLFLVYCCTYAELPEIQPPPFRSLYAGFLAGRWTGTLLMVKFRPQDMLLVYALINVLLCIVVVCLVVGQVFMPCWAFLFHVYHVSHSVLACFD